MHYRSLLLERYKARREKNSAYSMRAFARDLGVSKTSLSDILAGKRDFSRRNLIKIEESLSLSPVEIKDWKRIQGPPEDRLLVKEDEFQLISDWQHFGILSLARLPACRASLEWISERLGISQLEAKLTRDRLVRMGFIQVKGPNLIRTAKALTTTTDISSVAQRKYQAQNLDLARASLERDPVTDRDITSITFPVDPKRLPEAKAEITRFRRRLAKLSEGQNPSEIYTLAVQLFPLTKRGKSK